MRLLGRVSIDICMDGCNASGEQRIQNDRHTQQNINASTSYAVLAFLPRTFFGGVGFFSFFDTMMAETRARAAYQPSSVSTQA